MKHLIYALYLSVCLFMCWFLLREIHTALNLGMPFNADALAGLVMAGLSLVTAGIFTHQYVKECREAEA